MAGQTITGRPRTFDKEQVLDAAMRVFWRHGYEGASLQALTDAMGINKPSLYAAFGDKRALFHAAYERYITQELGFFPRALAQPTAYEVAASFLRGGIAVATRNGGQGCMATHAALATSSESSDLKQWLAARRSNGEAALRKRLQKAQRAGDLPATTDCRALAGTLYSLLQGFNVQGASGVSAKDLNAVAELVLQSLPLRRGA